MSPDIGGTLIRSLLTCHTQLWFFTHGINLDYDNEHILVGREIHKTGFSRFLREEKIGSIKIDVFKKNIIVEVKKSSSNIKSTIWQTKYYLWYIKEFHGIEMKGKVYIPLERKSIEVKINETDDWMIRKMMRDINKIKSMKSPPKPIKKSLCRGCSYYNLCWS